MECFSETLATTGESTRRQNPEEQYHQRKQDSQYSDQDMNRVPSEVLLIHLPYQYNFILYQHVGLHKDIV
jgi:hypothetical protein